MNFLTWSIIAAEIGFWVVIILGLTLRYIFNLKKAGSFFLFLTPVIDLLLLIITTIDLLKGGDVTKYHAMAAIYLGVSIAFGKSMIRWADVRFLYYIKKEGTKPEKKTGYAYARNSLKGSFQHLFGYIIGAGFLFILIYLVNDADRSSILFDTLKVWSIVLGIDFIISISYFIWPPGK
ncbi:hypothetical protein [Bacillus cereus]|uniref:hypothetical protein n=1 Tax=Bacillus cereus TaxID=1396 RepID=UPI000B4BD7D0|nr:hypothetical protein [Bacillus cereus]